MSAAVCDTNFFKFGEVCVRCPAGSGRMVEIDDEHSCNCENDMVTSAGNVNTTFEECVGEWSTCTCIYSVDCLEQFRKCPDQ